ncbi:MAG: hypothetical protein AAGG02_21775 [Cyanobacteria bacterium P01_H01_bin.15]
MLYDLLDQINRVFDPIKSFLPFFNYLFLILGILFGLLLSLKITTEGFEQLRLTAFAPSYHPYRQGRFATHGVAHATDSSQIQTAPLSQSLCIAYQFSIVRFLRYKNRKTILHTEQQGQQNLSVHTTRGTVRVNSCKIEFNTIHCEDKQDRPNEFSNQWSHQLVAEKKALSDTIWDAVFLHHHSLRLKESVLREGDKVYIFGRQAWVNQQRIFKDVIVTDKPDYIVVLNAAENFVIGAFMLCVMAYGVYQAALSLLQN